MSILDKARALRSLDPETTDRVTGKWYVHHAGGEVYLDYPLISHIHGNLYVGGVESGVRLPYHFRSVIQLYPYETYVVEHEPVETWRFDLDDSTDQDLSGIDTIALVALEAAETGDTVVHCQAGMNRSCLVVARALQILGFTSDEAIDTLRSKRTKYALCNPAFEAFVRDTPVPVRSGEAQGSLPAEDV